MLIQAETLFEAIQENKNLLVFDTRFALPGPMFDKNYGRQAYKEAHIPGAIFVDLEKDLSAPINPHSGRHPLPDGSVFLNKLQGWSVHPNSNIVIYDDKGGMIAARLWWMLRYWVNHKNVSLLDGGFQSWQQAQLPLEKQIFKPLPTDYRFQIDNRYIKSTDDILCSITQADTGVLVDARMHVRFTGEEENVDPIAGHIPGAVNLPCIDNLDENGKFLPKKVLQNRFAPILTRARDVAYISTCCGSGVTACHNIFSMEFAGYTGTNLYVGSWSEWIRDPDNPVAIGE